MSSKLSDRSGKIREYETPPSLLSENQEEHVGFQKPENINYIRERAERQAKQNLIFTGNRTSEERFREIEEQCCYVADSDEGVLIQRQQFHAQQGSKAPLGSRLQNFQNELDELKDYWNKNHKEKAPEDQTCELTAHIFIRYNIAAYLSTELDKKPFYHSIGQIGPNGRKQSWLEGRIGDGSLMGGLELGMREMREGASAIIITKPEWNYGPHGFPPRIPPNSTIVFWVRIERAMDEFPQHFIRMNCHQRRNVPLEVIIDQYKVWSNKALEQFEKGSNKVRKVRQDGTVTYENSGKCDHYANARRAALIWKSVGTMLDQVILKNAAEEEIVQIEAFNNYRRHCLGLRKAHPTEYRSSIYSGKKALHIYESLSPKTKDELIEKWVKVCFNVVDVMGRDPKTFYPDQSCLLEEFESMVKEEEKRKQGDEYEVKLTKKIQKKMKEVENKNSRIYQEWIETEAFRSDEEENMDNEGEIVSAKPTNYTKVINFKNLDLAKLEKDIPKEDREYYKGLLSKFVDGQDRDLMFSHNSLNKDLVKYLVALSNDVFGLFPVKKKATFDGNTFENLVLYKTKEDANELSELH